MQESRHQIPKALRSNDGSANSATMDVQQVISYGAQICKQFFFRIWTLSTVTLFVAGPDGRTLRTLQFYYEVWQSPSQNRRRVVEVTCNSSYGNGILLLTRQWFPMADLQIRENSRPFAIPYSRHDDKYLQQPWGNTWQDHILESQSSCTWTSSVWISPIKFLENFDIRHHSNDSTIWKVGESPLTLKNHQNPDVFSRWPSPRTSNSI